MIHIRDEGEPVKNGFNYYPLNSKNSVGVVLRVGKYALWLRYSKKKSKIFSSLQKQVELT